MFHIIMAFHQLCLMLHSCSCLFPCFHHLTDEINCGSCSLHISFQFSFPRMVSIIHIKGGLFHHRVFLVIVLVLCCTQPITPIILCIVNKCPQICFCFLVSPLNVSVC